MMIADDQEGPLSEREIQHFLVLLERICAHHIDQFANWSIGPIEAPVYITLSRALPSGTRPEMFNRPAAR